MEEKKGTEKSGQTSQAVDWDDARKHTRKNDHDQLMTKMAGEFFRGLGNNLSHGISQGLATGKDYTLQPELRQ